MEEFPTENGADPAQEEFSSLKRSRSSQLGKLTRLYKDLELKMISHENADDVQTLYETLCERFESFKSVHLHCLDLCTDPDVRKTLELNYESCSQNFFEFQERFSQWKSVQKTPDDEVIPSVSSANSVSSQAKLKNAKAKRLIAELKLKSLERKHELERARKELELKQQLLDQQSVLEEAQIEESVWQKSVEEENCVNIDENSNQTTLIDVSSCEQNVNIRHTDNEEIFQSGNSTALCISPDEGMNNNHRKTSGATHRLDADDIVERTNSRAARDMISADSYRPSNRSVYPVSGNETYTRPSEVSVSDIDTAFQKLAYALHEGFNLPKPELLTFSGKPTEYCKFIKNFETNIENRVSDDSQRLSYLIQYCYGEAKNCIEDCVLLEPSEGYKRAREILYSRYGRPHVITRTYIEKLVEGPQLSASDIKGISDLAMEMQKCEITLSQLRFSCEIDNSQNLRRIVKRLPMHLRVKWVEIAHAINECGREPRFSDLARFVDEKSRVANSMYGMDIVKENRTLKVESVTFGRPCAEKTFKKVTTLNTQSDTETKKYERKCRCCHGNCADLSSCVKFKSMSLNERNELVKRNKLCFNCLKGNHSFINCRKPKLCTVPDCSLKHNILLHSWTGPRNEPLVTQSSVNCAAVKNSFVKNCLGIVPVIVKGENGIQCHTYALLDDGADKTLCDERLLQKLNVDCKPITFQISTVNTSNSTSYGQEADLTVMAVNGTGNEEVSLRNVWSVKKLPISARSAAMNLDYKTFPYLSDIEIPQIPSTDVMLLIGTDSPAAHIPLEVRSGNSEQPYAVRSRLGWAIRGPIKDNTAPGAVNIHFEQSRDILLQEQLEKMWNTDFSDRLVNEKNSMSVEDKKALKIMKSSLIHKDGHYMMGLPWRNENGQLPNNIPLAQVRLQQLRNKLSRDLELHKMYTTTMNDYIEKGFATEVQETENCPKRIWYLPHHPVTSVNKPGKVRIVFDCAAKYKGVSLNSQLLQGPDLMNSLTGVIIRFRKEKVALAADIEAMFHQVHVTDTDRDVLRFLWWPDGDMTLPPKCYRMNVHLFGATSSPSCAAYAMKRTAVDNAEIFEPEVVSTVQRNFYVDDCLKSVESEQKAIKLAADLQSIMKLGGFRLTKWLSNSREVLSAIPKSERAPSVVNLSLDDTLPCDRALGVLWNVDEDRICFKVKLEEKPFTRRGILSVVSSIYDPLGLVSPVTLQAKGIVQTLCRLKIGWDDQIPYNVSNEWTSWLSTLPNLEKLFVDRCYRPDGFGTVKNTQLHIFSDGSERGYGACAYLRFVDVHENVHCSLVIGKSHLAPIKQLSIPRLELSGAVVGCRLFAILSEELDMNFDQVTFWTDSMIVLGYINNVSKRFKTFVGNRLSIIHDTTSPDQWRHVDTNSNPADIASRGVSADDTKNLHLWLNGPSFLLQDPKMWPENPRPPEVADGDNEVKKEVMINLTSAAECIESIMGRYSNWTKLKRAVAWLLRYKTFCRRQYLKHKLNVVQGNLTFEEIQTAEHNILLHVQNTAFPREINNLQSLKPVKKDSSIASLNPMIYDDLIRVQGRHQSRNPSKCPVILPKKHTVTKLIIRHIHENNGHAGRQHVLAASRDKYWILQGSSAVKNTVKNCIICRRQHTPLMTQQMAPLLPEQTTPDDPPFTNVGVDYFGPFVVKSEGTHMKRYGCIFTCLASRAVHLEVTHTLTADSFIAAFQRFTARRGSPKKVYSDNGTNLVSGDRQLRRSIQEWNKSKIGKYMVEREIEWIFNPPKASHRGGAWERLIRSTRTILKSLIKQQLLTDEQLLTLMAETERILNDRPITPVSDDPNDLLALTPNMLLLLKSNSSIPRGVFKNEDNYTKRWWKQVQYLANIFWRRWIREYIPTLQNRAKWQRKTKDLRVGDIVLVSDENTPRGQWPLGRVIQIRESRDGHVRSCLVKYKDTETVKSISKLCLLESVP